MHKAILKLTRTFSAPCDVVWKAWTDPARVAQWYGPEGFTTTIHSMDVRVGGSYALTMHAPDGDEHRLRGSFLEVDPPSKLVMTWQWEHDDPAGMGAETRVTVVLVAKGEHTELTLTHELPNDDSKKLHEMGWSSSFNKLGRLE